MLNNQNHTLKKSRSCILRVFRPFGVLSRWYCGHKYTEAGKAARVVCSISTLLMIASGALLYEHSKKDDTGNGKYDDSPFAIDYAITFSLGILGYIITPIIGRKCFR